MKKFSQYIAEKVNEKQIMKDLDSGMSADAVISKYANKKTTNTDEIRKVIKQHAWNKRMKKEETELSEVSAKKARRAAAASQAKAYTAGSGYQNPEQEKDADRLDKKSQKAMAHVKKRQGEKGVKRVNRMTGKMLGMEETDQIDEISPELAARYHDKAGRDMRKHADNASFARDSLMKDKKNKTLHYTTKKERGDMARKSERKLRNRAIGMSRAGSRMEEIDQIDEISPELAARYHDKAGRDMRKHADNATSVRDMLKKNKKSNHMHYTTKKELGDLARKSERKLRNRAVGMTRAGSRMEELDQIDEISPDLAARYHDKAGRNMNKHADNATFARDILKKNKGKTDGIHYTTKKELGDLARKSERKLRNRAVGMSRAGSRMEEIELDEKSVSQAQQKLMGMALAYKRGEMDDASDEVKKLASSMSEKDLEDFAKTKHKGLPKKVEESELDQVDKSQLKKKFDARADKDIDNDGDVDTSDKYLHKRRKAIAKAIAKKTK